MLRDAGFEAVARRRRGARCAARRSGQGLGRRDQRRSRPTCTRCSRKRTIPTGEQHGTVTVVTERGGEQQHVEVTTFRGEGAYTDARRPDRVVFGVPLVEDLARRDFT